MNKVALISGISGSDGKYLNGFLLEKGYCVFGTTHRKENVSDRVLYCDFKDEHSFLKVILDTNPDEIYNLAGQSSIKDSFLWPEYTSEINGLGVLRFLEAIRAAQKILKKQIKFFQAGSSEIFGNLPKEGPQNELTPINPSNPYGISKAFAHQIISSYRETYGMFCSSGILYNHSGPLSNNSFIVKKITNGVINILNGTQPFITLGNLDIMKDFGYSKEFVEGMWLIMRNGVPDDFVLATGQVHSIREVVEIAFKIMGIEIGWQGKGVDEVGVIKSTRITRNKWEKPLLEGDTIVKISDEFYRPVESKFLSGDATKALITLGWKAKVEIKELIEIMLEEQLNV